MKKTIFILLGIMVLNLNLILAQEYNIVVEAVFESSENTNMQHVKSAVDSKGNLHVVFADGNNNKPFYATNKSGKWEYENLTYFSEDYQEEVNVAFYPNIAIDKNDNISVTIFGRYKEDLLLAQKKTSDAKWKFISANKTSILQKFYVYAEYSDMCIDKNGGLHLICNADYTDMSGKKHDQSAVYFYKPISGNWQMQAILNGIVNEFIFGKHSSIISYENKVYASIGGSKNLHFATKNISGGQWKIEQILDTQNDMNAWKFETSLCVSNNGNLSFAFYDYYGKSDYKYHGLNIISKNKCKNDEWIIDQSIHDNLYKRSPAIGIDNNDKTYIAFGGKELYLFAKSCDCKQNWEQLYKDDNINSDYIDMVIDQQNNVHVFYAYEKKVYHLLAKPNSSTKKCNYPPIITSYTGKTNLVPGEKWEGTIAASDPECDKIKFESIIHNEIFTINDHGNGTATITATMPDGEGKGTPGISIWVLDDKHPNTDGKVSVITFQLVITPEGNEKGSIKVENKCNGSNAAKPISVGSTNQVIPSDNKSKKETAIGVNTSQTPGNADCEKFIKRYEDFAIKYVPVAKKVKSNPTDVQAAMKLSKLMEEFSSYSSEWVNLYDCHKIPKYKERYDKATEKIQNAN